MGDQDQQPASGPPGSASPEPGPPEDPADKKLGSEEAGLHESAGSGVTIPEWANSLSHGISQGPGRVDVDLAKRLREEEARIARERAEAARRAAEAAARKKAAEEAARRRAAEQAAAAAAAKRPRKISKWPSLLAAFVVILVGAFIGQRIIGSGESPQATVTAYPVVTAAPTQTAAPAKPATAQGDHVDTYTVKPGDTLESIAKQFNRTVVEISQANGAYGGLIRIESGQVINIP